MKPRDTQWMSINVGGVIFETSKTTMVKEQDSILDLVIKSECKEFQKLLVNMPQDYQDVCYVEV